MFDLVKIQLKEIEKAVIGMGEYRFKPAYKCLEVGTDKWFLMSSQQRDKHLKRVFDKACMPVEADAPIATDVVAECSQVRQLSISPEGLGILTISPEQLERTWEKAKRLLNSSGSICKAPDHCVLQVKQGVGLILFLKLKKEV